MGLSIVYRIGIFLDNYKKAKLDEFKSYAIVGKLD